MVQFKCGGWGFEGLKDPEKRVVGIHIRAAWVLVLGT